MNGELNIGHIDTRVIPGTRNNSFILFFTFCWRHRVHNVYEQAYQSGNKKAKKLVLLVKKKTLLFVCLFIHTKIQ